MMMYVWLVIGFILLIKGADFFVEGSSSIAKILKIPSIVIGLTIVAFGTSAPEAAVSITAALNGSNEIAVGNVIGSNLFNLLVVTGCCGAIMVMPINKDILKGDFPFSIVITVILMAMILMDLKLGRVDGIILLILFGYFLFRTVTKALKDRQEEEDEYRKLSPAASIVFILGGIAAIVAGGDLVVDSASGIAAAFGLSQTLIGLTIVAMGTSLPELVTSIVASRKGENELALGNVIGSNIFNILLILGLSSTIRPIPVTMLSVYDLICLIVFSAVTLLFAKQKMEIDRKEGIAMVLMYAAYMVYIVLR